jgi:hypothetical protein
VTRRAEERAREWDAGWEATRRRQQTLGLEVTAAERVRWLEEMIRLAHACGALPRRRDENGKVLAR